MYWRLILDPPQYMGMQQAAYESRVVPELRGVSAPEYDTDRKFTHSAQNILILTPRSVLSYNYASGSAALVPIGSLRHHPDQHIRDVKRAEEDSYLRVAVSAARRFTLGPPLFPPTVIALDDSMTRSQDRLQWTYETTFSLLPDQPFLLKFRASREEYQSKQNMMAVQWGRVLLHISFGGVLRLYEYPGGNLSQTPRLVSEQAMMSSRWQVNQDQWLVILPAAPRGIMVLHTMAQTRHTVSYR
ncbi:MAG: hypothetical protein RMJ43_03230, partial [Chloroherpetonaceae bacterium]|nr:hypothetical protein [Chloroherpetonaceae bacterium]